MEMHAHCAQIKECILKHYKHLHTHIMAIDCDIICQNQLFRTFCMQLFGFELKCQVRLISMLTNSVYKTEYIANIFK